MNSIGNIINQNRRQLLWKAVLGIASLPLVRQACSRRN